MLPLFPGNVTVIVPTTFSRALRECGEESILAVEREFSRYYREKMLGFCKLTFLYVLTSLLVLWLGDRPFFRAYLHWGMGVGLVVLAAYMAAWGLELYLGISLP